MCTYVNGKYFFSLKNMNSSECIIDYTEFKGNIIYKLLNNIKYISIYEKLYIEFETKLHSDVHIYKTIYNTLVIQTGVTGTLLC